MRHADSAAGNLTGDGTASYSYDPLNRLTGTSASGQSRSYAYNGDGTLVSQTTNGASTSYAQDQAADQSQVLAATIGITSTDYLYGGDLAPLATLSESTRTWYGLDGQGSVRQTLDDSGAVLGTQNYDPYGQAEGATHPTTFGYGGELQDSVTNAVYLRARWYLPATGTLLGVDPLLAGTGQPYAYASDNPVHYEDPSGRYRISIWAAAFIKPAWVTFEYFKPTCGIRITAGLCIPGVNIYLQAQWNGNNRSYWDGTGIPPTQREGSHSSKQWNYVTIETNPSLNGGNPEVAAGTPAGEGHTMVRYSGGVDEGQAPDPAAALVSRYQWCITDPNRGDARKLIWVSIDMETSNPLAPPLPPDGIIDEYDIVIDAYGGTLQFSGSHTAFPWHELLVIGPGFRRALDRWDPGVLGVLATPTELLARNIVDVPVRRINIPKDPWAGPVQPQLA